MNRIFKNNLNNLQYFNFNNNSFEIVKNGINKLKLTIPVFEYFPVGFTKLGFFSTYNRILTYNYIKNVKKSNISSFNVIKYSLFDLYTGIDKMSNYNNHNIAITKDYIYDVHNGFVFRTKNELESREYYTVRNFLRNNINNNTTELIAYITCNFPIMDYYLRLEYGNINSEFRIENYNKKEVVIFNKYIKDKFIKNFLTKNDSNLSIRIMREDFVGGSIFNILKQYYGFVEVNNDKYMFNLDLYFNTKTQSIVDESPKQDVNEDLTDLPF